MRGSARALRPPFSATHVVPRSATYRPQSFRFLSPLGGLFLFYGVSRGIPSVPPGWLTSLRSPSPSPPPGAENSNRFDSLKSFKGEDEGSRKEERRKDKNGAFQSCRRLEFGPREAIGKPCAASFAHPRRAPHIGFPSPFEGINPVWTGCTRSPRRRSSTSRRLRPECRVRTLLRRP